jgi:hypothetical protein
MLRLYTTLVRSKLEYASVAWNLITSTDANKLERIQQRFAALFFNRFFPEVNYCYSIALDELKVHTLRMRRQRLDALFLTQIFFGYKFCPSVLEIVSLRVPSRYIIEFALIKVCSSWKNCPSARCASAANVVCRDVDVFGARNVLLNRFLKYTVFVIYYLIIINCMNINKNWVKLLILLLLLLILFCSFVCLLLGIMCFFSRACLQLNFDFMLGLLIMLLFVPPLCWVCNFPCSSWLDT